SLPIALHPLRSPPFPYTTLFRSSVIFFRFLSLPEDRVRTLFISIPPRKQRDMRLPAGRIDGRGVFGEEIAIDVRPEAVRARLVLDRKSTRLNSSHDQISYAVFCL